MSGRARAGAKRISERLRHLTGFHRRDDEDFGPRRPRRGARVGSRDADETALAGDVPAAAMGVLSVGQQDNGLANAGELPRLGIDGVDITVPHGLPGVIEHALAPQHAERGVRSVAGGGERIDGRVDPSAVSGQWQHRWNFVEAAILSGDVGVLAPWQIVTRVTVLSLESGRSRIQTLVGPAVQRQIEALREPVVRRKGEEVAHGGNRSTGTGSTEAMIVETSLPRLGSGEWNHLLDRGGWGAGLVRCAVVGNSVDAPEG